MFNQILHNTTPTDPRDWALDVPAALGATRATTGATPTDAAAPSGPRSSIPTGATNVPEPACKCTHTQLDHLGALCNHLEEASACFATHPGGVYSDNLRNYNLAPGGAHKLPSPCSVMWNSNPGSDAYRWDVHFLLEDFLEVIEGLFADGRLNATRQQDCLPEGLANDFEVYLAGDFTVQTHSSVKGRHYYELSYTPATMSNLRLFTLVEQEDLGNIRATLARYGIHIKWEE